VCNASNGLISEATVGHVLNFIDFNILKKIKLTYPGWPIKNLLCLQHFKDNVYSIFIGWFLRRIHYLYLPYCGNFDHWHGKVKKK